MSVRVDRTALVGSLAGVSRLVETRPVQPILGNVVVESDGRNLGFRTFNYETYASSQVPIVAGDDVFRCLVNGKMLAEASRRLGGATVEFDLRDNMFTARARASSIELPVSPLEEYPSLPMRSHLGDQVDTKKFVDAVNTVILAASRDSTVPLLSGVHVSASDVGLRFVATDRYRLAVAHVPWNFREDHELPEPVTLPARMLGDAARVLSDSGAEAVSLELSAGMSRFGAGTSQIGLNGIDGNYPPVERLWPETFSVDVTVSREAIIDALRTVQPFSGSRLARVSLTFEGDGLTISAEASDTGRAEAVINGVDYSPSSERDAVFFANAGFLLDALQSLDGTFARLGFTLPGRPILIERVGELPESDAFRRHLVMSMNV